MRSTSCSVAQGSLWVNWGFCRHELSFQEVEKLEALKPTLEVFMAEFNETNKAAQLNIPMFSYMIE